MRAGDRPARSTRGRRQDDPAAAPLMEVDMSQDADVTGLVVLIWAAWIYWNVYWWLDRLASSNESEKERRHNLLDRPTDAQPALPQQAPAGRQTLDALISEILHRDGTADIAEFLSERLASYETIVAAFDAGDLDALRPLLSPDVFAVFADAILSREQSRLCHVETLFSQIEPAEIVGGSVGEARMDVSVRFVGECFRVRRDDAGRRLPGAPVKSRTADIWTFARTPDDRTWRVTATEAA
jgi:predicted lipid-binding transport protein (Tim44 family)